MHHSYLYMTIIFIHIYNKGGRADQSPSYRVGERFDLCLEEFAVA